VYDAFNVWRNYGTGDIMPAISDAQFKQVGVAMPAKKRTRHAHARGTCARPGFASMPCAFTAGGRAHVVRAGALGRLLLQLLRARRQAVALALGNARAPSRPYAHAPARWHP
jgi:hypothetical protein